VGLGPGWAMGNAVRFKVVQTPMPNSNPLAADGVAVATASAVERLFRRPPILILDDPAHVLSVRPLPPPI
jgi:hypothetical protein